jgi:hypothetical protein
MIKQYFSDHVTLQFGEAQDVVGDEYKAIFTHTDREPIWGVMITD